ncbi:hypothetical protein ACXYN8_07030 [Altererythrobacter sp. CAU 1778]
MRIALLQTPSPVVADKKLLGLTLGQHQVRFACAAGCERIVVVAPKADAAAFALQETAEKGGARFDVIADVASLLGMVHTEDQVLVIASDLLPRAESVLGVLGQKPAILYHASDHAVHSADFERIDRDRHWSGAMVLPGRLIDRLGDLPRDTDIPSALLRIGLQGGVPVVPLELSDSRQEQWALIGAGEQLDELSQTMFRGGGAPAAGLEQTIADAIMRRFGAQLLNRGWNAGRFRVVTAVALLLAVMLAWFWSPVAGILLVGVASLLKAIAEQLQRAAGDNGATTASQALKWACDGALFAVLALALFAFYYRWGQVWYLPLLLVGLIRVSEMVLVTQVRDWVTDRLSWALLLAVIVYGGWLEGGLQYLTAALVLLPLVSSGVSSRKNAGSRLTAN